MGYYTRYELDTSDSESESHEAAIGKMIDYFPFEDDTKWYDHEEDMVKYSRNYPEVVFRLDGTGEEAGDVWVKWFKNGEVQSWRLAVEKPVCPPGDWSL